MARPSSSITGRSTDPEVTRVTYDATRASALVNEAPTSALDWLSPGVTETNTVV